MWLSTSSQKEIELRATLRKKASPGFHGFGMIELGGTSDEPLVPCSANVCAYNPSKEMVSLICMTAGSNLFLSFLMSEVLTS